jgi:hypothetical protein
MSGDERVDDPDGSTSQLEREPSQAHGKPWRPDNGVRLSRVGPGTTRRPSCWPAVLLENLPGARTCSASRRSTDRH